MGKYFARAMKPAWIIGFSGHRSLTHPALVRQALEHAMRGAADAIHRSGGQLHLYVSAAYGADLRCIEVAESMGIPVHIILPKPVVYDERGEVSFVEGFASDFLDADGQPMLCEWQQAHAFIRKAMEGTDGWTYRLVNGTQVEPECYYDAGIQIMEAADLFLAVWNRLPARGLGGTAEMVEQADKLLLPLQIINPENGEIESMRYENFQPQTDQGHKLMRSLALDPSLDSKSQFALLDERANVHSKEFRNTAVRGIWLQAMATVTAAVAALLHGSSTFIAQIVAALALFEWVLVVVAWIKLKRLSRGKTHSQWLRSRFAVELMRAMFGSITLIDPLNPPIARHKKEWARFAVSAGLRVAAECQRNRAWQEERDAYVAARLDDPRNGQIAHFRQKQAAAAPVFDRLTRVHKVASSCAVIFVFGAFLYKGFQAVHGTVNGDTIKIPPGWPSVTVAFFSRFLPIALPLIAGVAAALRNARDSGRRKYRYGELAKRLSIVREQLRHLKTESSCRRCVSMVEDLLLDELIEWHLSETQKAGGNH
jgi:hypothetical protein